MQQKTKYGGIVILSAALCLLLHILLPAALTTETPPDSLSGLAQQLGFPLTALLWALMAYGCLAVVFYLIGNRIPGKTSARGRRYGIAIGALWLLGYVMCLPKFGNPFTAELAGGLCDALPVLIMGEMLGRITDSKFTPDTMLPLPRVPVFAPLTMFTLVFFLARTAAYYLDLINIGLQLNAAYTLGWTLLMGLALGLFYILLGQAVTTTAALNRAFRFGFLLFGSIWGSFIMFFPLILQGELFHTLRMLLIDMLAVTAAYYWAERSHVAPQQTKKPLDSALGQKSKRLCEINRL
ncbi:MAG TPA: hypothetical protein VN611_05325 [Patescibacteria group bacterium]|nr:hypothetical protein [Patescibacteria group bacterium]